MLGFLVPWIDGFTLLPLLGAAGCWWAREQRATRNYAIGVSVLTLLCTLAAWIDLRVSDAPVLISDHFVLEKVLGAHSFAVDQVNAPVLSLTALVYFVTILATLKTKIGRFSFSRTLLSEAIVLMTISCPSSRLLVLLLIASAIPVWWELGQRGQCRRVFTLHMSVAACLMAVGFELLSLSQQYSIPLLIPVSLLLAGTLIRIGIAPAHCWVIDLFEKGTFGTAILFVAPLTGVYGFVRLVLPIAPDWGLFLTFCTSLFTAAYAAGMGTIETEPRRVFCYLFLSNSALVLAGLALSTPIGMTAGMCLWISVSVALTGLGLVLRCVESRSSRISLAKYHGLFPSMPALAGFFLLTGMASIGFPGTIGFISLELLVDGAVESHAVAGVVVVICAALNGITVLSTYFRVFTGRRHECTIPVAIRPPERVAVLVLSFLILAGGSIPQPGVSSRFRAAMELKSQRSTSTHSVASKVTASRPPQTNAQPIPRQQ